MTSLMTTSSSITTDAYKDKAKKARVLYDYEAEDNSQLSLLTDQVISCSYVLFQVDLSIGDCSVSYRGRG